MSAAFAVASSQVCRRGSERMSPRETTLLCLNQGDHVVYSTLIVLLCIEGLRCYFSSKLIGIYTKAFSDILASLAFHYDF